MMQDETQQSYETPTLNEIGLFSELTSGNGDEEEDMTSRFSWW